MLLLQVEFLKQLRVAILDGRLTNKLLPLSCKLLEFLGRAAIHILQRAFVSCSLWEQDKNVANFFREIFQLHEIIPRTVGIDLHAETDAKAAEIAKNEIKTTNGVIVILTPRYYVNGYKSSEWTYEEPSMGFYGDKPIYLFYERGTNLKE